MDKPIRKAVFPVAGLGTRFLPATKAMPKEMLTVVDRPILQHVVDEAREAGIEHFIFVTGRNKARHRGPFRHAYELEDTLQTARQDREYAALMADLPAAGATSFTRQQAPLGPRPRRLVRARARRRRALRGPAARHGDDGRTRGGRCLAQCVEAYERARRQCHRGRGSAAGRDPSIRHRRRRRGSWRDLRDHRHGRKAASRERRPSNLIISGRYILQPEIFELLEKVEKGAGGEIQLTDGMIKLAGAPSPFTARASTGEPIDCGSKLGFLTANLAFALDRGDIAPGLKEELRRLGFAPKGA